METLRSGKRSWKPEDHNEADPFGNPLRTIQLVAKRFAKPIAEVDILAHSTPRPNTTLNHYVMSLKKAKPTGGSVDEAVGTVNGHLNGGETVAVPLSSESQAVLNALLARWTIKPNTSLR